MADKVQMNELFSKYKDNPELETIPVQRLLEVLQTFGKNPSKGACQQRIAQLRSDRLTFEDFKRIINEPWVSANNDRNRLRKALQSFDQSNEGFIDAKQFQIAMRTLGEPLSEKETDALIHLGLKNTHEKIEIEYLLGQLLGNNA